MKSNFNFYKNFLILFKEKLESDLNLIKEEILQFEPISKKLNNVNLIQPEDLKQIFVSFIYNIFQIDELKNEKLKLDDKIKNISGQQSLEDYYLQEDWLNVIEKMEEFKSKSFSLVDKTILLLKTLNNKYSIEFIQDLDEYKENLLSTLKSENKRILLESLGYEFNNLTIEKIKI